jgi:hypothetical protein
MLQKLAFTLKFQCCTFEKIMKEMQIGNSYGGGIIFFLDEKHEHGLVASEKDLSGEADWDEAMEFCMQYDGGGFTDWRLPNDELNLLYLQKERVGGFVRFSYWSATEYAGHFAFFQNFYTGERDNDFKDNTCYVRAVRSF